MRLNASVTHALTTTSVKMSLLASVDHADPTSWSQTVFACASHAQPIRFALTIKHACATSAPRDPDSIKLPKHVTHVLVCSIPMSLEHLVVIVTASLRIIPLTVQSVRRMLGEVPQMRLNASVTHVLTTTSVKMSLLASVDLADPTSWSQTVLACASHAQPIRFALII